MEGPHHILTSHPLTIKHNLNIQSVDAVYCPAFTQFQLIVI